MLEEIVTALLNREDDIEVVREPAGPTDLLALVGSAETDVLILGSPGSEAPRAVEPLLRKHPDLQVFTVTPDGRDAFRIQLEPRSFPIREVSPKRLVDEVREALSRLRTRGPTGELK